MVTAVLEASHRWAFGALAGLAFLAPFNVDVMANTLPDLQLRVLVIVASLVVVGLAIRSLSHPRWHRPDAVDSLAYAWMAAVWISALLSSERLLGSGGAVRLSVAALLIPATRHVVQSQADARRIMRALALGAVVAAALGLVLLTIGRDLNLDRVFVGDVTMLGSFDRLTRPWAHANVAAMAMGASLAMTGVLGSARLRVTAAALLVVALVLTISRGGLMALGAAALTWVVLRRSWSQAAAVSGLVALGVGVVFFSPAWTTRIDQLGDEAFYASSLQVPVTFELGGSDDQVQVTVINDSSVTWFKSGEGRVLVSARWLGPDGLIWSEDRWELPSDLEPGGQLVAGLGLEPRLPVGSYDVRWDLLIQDRAFFGQFLGDAPILSRATITRSAVAASDVFRYDLVERSLGLGRVDTWRLGWQNFLASPFVGVGPNQLGERASVQLASDQRRAGSHAHSVVLEPLSAWGVLGAAPFVLLGVGALWRAIRVARKQRGAVPVALAAGLIAIVVHGLVDWPLVTIGTVIPVGLLVGIAWSEASSIDA